MTMQRTSAFYLFVSAVLLRICYVKAQLYPATLDEYFKMQSYFVNAECTLIIRSRSSSFANAINGQIAVQTALCSEIPDSLRTFFPRGVSHLNISYVSDYVYFIQYFTSGGCASPYEFLEWARDDTGTGDRTTRSTGLTTMWVGRSEFTSSFQLDDFPGDQQTRDDENPNAVASPGGRGTLLCSLPKVGNDGDNQYHVHFTVLSAVLSLGALKAFQV